MNRQTKKEIRRLAVKILVAVLALGLAFWGYAFVYRGKTEPPAKYPVTNQDAAVYSLRGQIQMLSQQEELYTDVLPKLIMVLILFLDLMLQKHRFSEKKILLPSVLP